MNKKIIAWALTGALVIGSLTPTFAADSTATKNNSVENKKTEIRKNLTDEQKNILKKKRAGETLTTEEQAKISWLKKHKKGGKGAFHKQNLTEEQKAKIKAIRAIKNKQSSGQSLTAEEQKLLQEHEAKKAQRKAERTNKKTDTSTKQ